MQTKTPIFLPLAHYLAHRWVVLSSDVMETSPKTCAMASYEQGIATTTGVSQGNIQMHTPGPPQCAFAHNCPWVTMSIFFLLKRNALCLEAEEAALLPVLGVWCGMRPATCTNTHLAFSFFFQTSGTVFKTL